MTNSPSINKLALPLIVVFAVVTLFVLFMKAALLGWGFNTNLVLYGNLLLFTVSLLSLLLYQRAISHATTIGFLRNTYGGLFLKLLTCIIAVLIYIMNTSREHINKQGIIACLALYFIYTLLEIRSLLHWNKARKNA